MTGALLNTDQVFVANPNKPPQIASILRRNKDKLLVFLQEFHNDKDGGFRHVVYEYPLIHLRRAVQREQTDQP